MVPETGIYPGTFLRIGIYLYETQKRLDMDNKKQAEENEAEENEAEENEAEENEAEENEEEENEEDENEAEEILKDTIEYLEEKKKYILDDINKLYTERVRLKNDYKHNLRNVNQKMSNSSYNMIFLKSNNIKTELNIYFKKIEKNKILIQELIISKDAISESIESLKCKIK